MRINYRAWWLASSVALAIGTAARADFDPIPLTPGSFTHDVVVEKEAPKALNSYVTASMDGGTNNTGATWFEQGYVSSSPMAGLPHPGESFQAVGDSSRSFILAANYAANNALVVYTALPGGALSLTTPAAYSGLSVLGASAGGNATLNYKIVYQGGGSQSGEVIIQDWYSSAAEVACNANGRVNLDNGQLQNLNGTVPKLFYADIWPDNSSTPIVRVEFSSTSGNRAAIFGITGLDSSSTWVPLTLTGFNRDVIVEQAAPATGFLMNATTVTMDDVANNNLGTTWYEAGFNIFAPTTGLPAAGTQVANANHTFTMPASYAENNALYLANFGDYTTGTLTFNTPAKYSGLSFLAAAGNGPLSISATVYHQDLSSEPITIEVPDWFSSASTVIYTSKGRFNVGTIGFDNVNSTDPDLHAVDVPISNSSSPITQIDFAYASGGRGPIFAVSGQATTGGNYTPIAVSGFNADVVVEASQNFAPLGLRAYTTATMDGGVNNTGNTWYERGYYAAFPNSGLPPAGSLVTSTDKADHHYRMPATYAGPNAAFVDSVRSNVNLTLAVPAAYSALSFLSATANNNVTNRVIIQFQNGTSETNTFVSRDWFNNSPSAFTAGGRVDMVNGTINNAGGSNPRLYEAEFALANNTSPVTNVVLQFLGAINPTTGRMVVLAVSATAGAVRPIIATQPASVLTMEGANASLAATLGGGDHPMTYQWYAGANNVYVPVANDSVVSGATTPTLTFTGIGQANAADYIFVASNSAGSSTSAVATVTVRSGLPDVTVPGDQVAIFAGSTPANEDVPNAINNTTTKYLQRDADNAGPFDPPVGFTLTPSVGSTILKGLRFYTANDSEGRDPASYQLEGSNDGGSSYQLIASGPLALPAGRNAAEQALDPLTQALQEVRFANTAAYTSYKLSFNSVKDMNQQQMQIGEVEFLGAVADVSGPPVVRRDVPASVLVYAGRTFTVSALFGGTAPLTYTWQKNGVSLQNDARISGADTDTLTIVNARPSDAGDYQLLVRNALEGPIPSGTAAVIVSTTPDFNNNGLGWVLNGNNGRSVFADNVLKLTDGQGSEARSAYFKDKLYIGAFKASFTYQDVGGNGADGFTFLAQNAGPTALGGAGGDLGYSGLTPSAAVMFNIYNNGDAANTIAVGVNGQRVSDYDTTAPVKIAGGNPIKVDLAYSGGIVQVTLQDTVENSTFTTSVPLDLPGLAGGETAYVGFTAATGGIASTQTIENFEFVPLPTLSATGSSATEVTLSWPASIGGYVLQSRSSLSSGTWQAATIQPTLVGDTFQATVPSTGSQFYRLALAQ